MTEEVKKKVTEFFNKFLTPEAKAKFKEEFGDIPALTVTPTTPATPAAMTTAKLKDGTVIKYDTPTLIEGTTTITVVGQDGTELPAPSGDWELEDGTMVTIAEGGKLVKVVAPAAAPAEQVVQSATPDAATKLVEALKTLMEGRFAEQAKLIESLTEENKTLKAEFSKQTEVINTVSAFFNAIGETPTGTPVVTETNKPSKKQKPLTYL